jgi:uncharacterized coiled-coil DUF342 family protein
MSDNLISSLEMRELFRERERLELIKDTSLLDEVSRRRVIKRITEISSQLNQSQDQLVVVEEGS